jgi:hypothetical protein
MGLQQESPGGPSASGAHAAQSRASASAALLLSMDDFTNFKQIGKGK